MVNISKALNSEKVQHYHTTDYANADQRAYYIQDENLTGQWHGQLGADMGLTGAVSAEHFRRLAEGQDPRTGEQLVRHRLATEDSAAHRAGWDATFSAPKSVSLTALVGNDHRIIEAHREAVKAGLDYLESSIEARIGGNNPSEHTGKWVAATFEHDTSRPVDGYSAPQLHTHAVFFNIAKTEDGKTHALQERHVFAAQKTATAIYQAHLGYRLRQFGYELEDGKGGAREIHGYSPEYLKANSCRSEQIDSVAKELEAQGLNRAEARQRAAHSTRQAKGHQGSEQTRVQQQALAQEHGNQHEYIIANAQTNALRTGHAMTLEHALKAAAHATTYSRDKTFEGEAVAPQREILLQALRRGQDHTTPALIQNAIQARQDCGEFLVVTGPRHQPSYTTPEMLRMESTNIQIMKAGQNRRTAFIKESPALSTRIDPHFAKFEADAATQTDPDRRQQLQAAIINQKQAIRAILTSTDQVQALQGAAGTGKTTSLTVVRKELEKEGYVVKGFAPTSRAAAQLEDCGAKCSTLQLHLATPQPQNQRPTVYFLDETSLASTKQINQLLTNLEPADRVLLIGDVRQHESVDAGRAFAQLQEQGISTAKLDVIVRQRDQSLREVVQLLADNHVTDAVNMLQAQGRVTEIPNEQARFTAIAADYLKDPGNSLVVSPDNRSRAAINQVIHKELQAAGNVEATDHPIRVLVNRQDDVTGADRTWAKRYEVGNVIRYNTGSKQLGLNKAEYVTVKAVDADANLLTVHKVSGKDVTYDPKRCHGVSIYRPETKRFAVGDRIQFTSPSQKHKTINRDQATITKISNTTISAKLASGRHIHFDTKEYAHLDHGYAVTSHSGQGLTTTKTIANIDSAHTNKSLLNTRLTYVAVSRGSLEAQIYTNDASTLAEVLSTDVSKSSAITLSAQPDGRTQSPSSPDQSLTRGPDETLQQRPRACVLEPYQVAVPPGTRQIQQTPSNNNAPTPGDAPARANRIQQEQVEEYGFGQ